MVKGGESGREHDRAKEQAKKREGAEKALEESETMV
jgi:hypothetical protein